MNLNLIFETTLRTIAVAALAGLGLAAFRVRSSTVKLAVWRLVLFASLLMPLVAFLPQPRVLVARTPAPVARVIHRAQTQFVIPAVPRPASMPIDWSSVALRAYALVASILLLRAALGLLRIRQLGIDATPIPDLGPEVYETSRLSVPVTYGFRNPRILIPADWHTWSDETLDAVLAHERSHIHEHDFLTQCLSKLNRAIYWANPLAWWLDRTLATLAEHASDDAALNRIGERPAYAAMLLGFAGRQSNLAIAGVSMARNTGGIAGRIDRVLDDARALSYPLSPAKRAILAIAAFAAVIVIGAGKMSTVASAQTVPPPPPPAPHTTEHMTTRIDSVKHLWMNDHDRDEWVLVTPRGTSMNGSSGSAARARAMASRVHGDYLWFSRDGKEYLVDDPKTIAEIESWFAPMEELGRQQEELGRQQEVLGEQMSKLGDQMSRLGDQMSQ
ncbi:MAG TPA: M56 family metallopeptidase, partial [Bryobacteraceae bacterium]